MLRLPLKFLLLPATQVVAIAGMLLGNGYTFLGLGVFAFLALGFDLFDDPSEADEFSDLGAIGQGIVYSIVVLEAVLIWTALAAAASAAGWAGIVGAVLTLGQVLAVCAVNVGHELAHGRSRFDVELGRAVVAPSLHTSSNIDHVYHHHRAACTPEDAVSARRGEPFIDFLVRAVPAQIAWAWEFGKRRSQKRGGSVWSAANPALRGHVMEAAYLLGSFILFGWTGLLVALAAALVAIRAIESMFYMAHYGLVRVPHEPFEARHCWNSRRVISAGYMLNLTRHSHHHIAPSEPYWKLRIDDDMPLLPLGPGLMCAIAPVPALWRRAMASALAEWDARFASDGELRIIAEEDNKRLGHDLMEHAT